MSSKNFKTWLFFNAVKYKMKALTKWSFSYQFFQQKFFFVFPFVEVAEMRSFDVALKSSEKVI
jgi:hypothetical protein